MIVWQHIRCIKIGRPGTPVPGLFFAIFVCICLKVTKGHFCHYVLFAENQEGGCIPATTFPNSKDFLLFFRNKVLRN